MDTNITTLITNRAKRMGVTTKTVDTTPTIARDGPITEYNAIDSPRTHVELDYGTWRANLLCKDLYNRTDNQSWLSVMSMCHGDEFRLDFETMQSLMESVAVNSAFDDKLALLLIDDNESHRRIETHKGVLLDEASDRYQNCDHVVVCTSFDAEMTVMRLRKGVCGV